MLHRFLPNRPLSKKPLPDRLHRVVAITIAGITLAATVFTGCATTTETTKEPLLPRRFVSTVSSSTGLFTPSRSTPILWNGAIDITDSAHLLSTEHKQLINNIVSEELKSRGYQFSATADNARFAMKAVLLVGSDADKQQLNSLSGVAPELHEGDSSQTGALGIYFNDTDTQQIVWKSATEILIHSQLPQAKQAERIRFAIKQMLSGLPPAK